MNIYRKLVNFERIFLILAWGPSLVTLKEFYTPFESR